ncbi:hypothetical protein FKM82_023363 [Ascaphus truei]|uniref:putative G-protein coupled receptor 33 n=1 Tax=Ascaphus truei TaxID=8439 RepID=UPI003F59ADBA
MAVDFTSDFQINSTAGRGPANIPTSQLISALVLLLTFLFGLIGNSLYLWVLGIRMSKTVNTTWFFHYILANVVFNFTIPFLAVFVLMYPHWMFGTLLCKLINSLLSLCMYAAVFLLTVISLDRYLLVFCPHWYRRHMNPRYASAICLLLWGLAILCSSPYLAFRQVRYMQDNKTTICYNDYTFSGRWDEQQKLHRQVKWSMFYFHLLLGFLLPFFVITICYLQIALKMKSERLARSNKPFKIIFIAITSFFISWIPYHVWYGMSVENGRFPQSLLNKLQVLATCSVCFNCCFTPILYLFIVESFKVVFRKSILSLIESAFKEGFVSGDRSQDDKSEALSSIENDGNQGQTI